MRAKLHEKFSKAEQTTVLRDPCDVAAFHLYTMGRNIVPIQSNRLKCTERIEKCVSLSLCDENECDTLYNHPNEPHSKRQS